MGKFHFEVTGRGEFPLDMLRYDACEAETDYDEGKIDGGIYDHKRRTVELTTDADYIHPGRWESFGWKVVNSPPGSSMICVKGLHHLEFITEPVEPKPMTVNELISALSTLVGDVPYYGDRPVFLNDVLFHNARPLLGLTDFLGDVVLTTTEDYLA